MENYKHILLAVDFYEHCEAVANRAKDLAIKYQAKLSIIHVVDSLPITDAGYGVDIYGADIPFNIDLTAELMAGAKKRLAKLAEKLGVTEDRLWLEMGSPKTEIIRVAEENKVDLIVIGSHGRHGLALLLGSTANGVLHHATCDVLAVRLQDN
jgi:universal stress protein A